AAPPSDVKEIFKKYSGDEVHMTSDQFRRFIEEDYEEVDFGCGELHGSYITRRIPVPARKIPSVRNV
ncbi:hypothetical protein Tco_0384622, partial [Tanacetum coccineum]